MNGNKAMKMKKGELRKQWRKDLRFLMKFTLKVHYSI